MYVIAPSAVIVIVALALFFLSACTGPVRLADGSGCERIKVTGDTSYVVAYRMDDGWYLSAPGEGASTVREGQTIVVDKDARMGVIAFLDAKGVQARAYNWNIRGPQRRFCLQ